MENTSSLIFITGGVRSGKSSFAEELAIKESLKSGGSLHYIATGVSSDPEMAKRIERHKKERAESIRAWTTWEHPTDLSTIATHFSRKDILLLDCVTTLVNNEFFQTESWDPAFCEKVLERIFTGILSLKNQCQTLIVVSNELLHDGQLNHELNFTYSRVIGQMHQRIVEIANQAYLVQSRIPMLMKNDVR